MLRIEEARSGMAAPRPGARGCRNRHPGLRSGNATSSLRLVAFPCVPPNWRSSGASLMITQCSCNKRDPSFTTRSCSPSSTHVSKTRFRCTSRVSRFRNCRPLSWPTCSTRSGARDDLRAPTSSSGAMLAASACLFEAGGLNAAGPPFICMRRRLLRVRWGERGLPDRQRDLPDRIRAEALAVFFFRDRRSSVPSADVLTTLPYRQRDNRTGPTIGTSWVAANHAHRSSAGWVERAFGSNAEGKSPLRRSATA